MRVQSFDAETLLDEAVAEYLVAVDQGNPLNLEALLRKYSPIRAELLKFLEVQAGVAEDLACWKASTQQADNPTSSDANATGDFSPLKTNTPRRTSETTIPGFKLIQELGKGGMGVVYQALQVKANRLVALKMILSTEASESERERFRIEAEAIAGVDHPNIVKVFEVGEHDDKPYFALEYCPNGSLAGRLKEGPLEEKEAARLVSKLASAMGIAHETKIIHRDLKPANILIGNDGEPKIADFGLAKRLDDDTGQTHTHAIMGTPTYMAPEQAFGETKNASPAMDIYSLGVMLYECLTGTVPFRGATIPDTLDQVRNREPIPVRQLQPRVARDLETITMKCLQKDPTKRYLSSQALADDLHRWLEHKPIVARPVGRVERSWKWAKRNPAVTILFTTLVLVLTTGMIISLYLKSVADYEAAEANQQKNRAIMNFNEGEKKLKKFMPVVTLVLLPSVDAMDTITTPPIPTELYEQAIEFLLDYAEQEQSSHRELNDRIRAFTLASQLQMKLHQDIAEQTAAKARRLRRQIDNPLIEDTIADCMDAMTIARGHLSKRRYDQSLPEFQSAHRLITEVWKKQQQPHTGVLYGTSLIGIARSLYGQRKIDDMIRVLAQDEVVLNEIAKLYPNHQDVRQMIAEYWLTRGDAHEKIKSSLRELEPGLQRAYLIYRTNRETYPTSEYHAELCSRVIRHLITARREAGQEVQTLVQEGITAAQAIPTVFDRNQSEVALGTNTRMAYHFRMLADLFASAGREKETVEYATKSIHLVWLDYHASPKGYYRDVRAISEFVARKLLEVGKVQEAAKITARWETLAGDASGDDAGDWHHIRLMYEACISTVKANTRGPKLSVDEEILIEEFQRSAQRARDRSISGLFKKKQR